MLRWNAGGLAPDKRKSRTGLFRCRLIARPIRTIRVIPDEPSAPPAIISPVPFEERWQTTTQFAPQPVLAATAELPAQASKIRTTRAELNDDPVCGDKGRRYFYIGRHKYWKCRR